MGGTSRLCVWAGFLELEDMRILEINSPGLPVSIIASNLIENHEGGFGNVLTSS